MTAIEIDPRVLESDLALEVCLASREHGPSSAGELAKAAGKQGQSSLKRVLPTLIAAGALTQRSDRRGKREVEVFIFNEAWGSAVDDAIERASVGRLDPGDRVVLVGAQILEGAARLLREERFRREVSWLVEFDDSALGVALVLQKSGGRGAAAGLTSALGRLSQRGSGEAVRLRVGRVLARPQIDEWITDLLDKRDAEAQLEP